MRAYTVATVAVALSVKGKWIDNVLSHHRVPGVVQSRQGVSRRLTSEAVAVLAIALLLSRSLDITAPRALEIAGDLVRSGGPSPRYDLAGKGELLLNLADIEADLADRLAQAVESAPIPRRGRPRIANR